LICDLTKLQISVISRYFVGVSTAVNYFGNSTVSNLLKFMSFTCSEM